MSRKESGKGLSNVITTNPQLFCLPCNLSIKLLPLQSLLQGVGNIVN